MAADEEKKRIGRTIRRYREAAGLTPEEVARKLNVTSSAVRKWESGEHVPRLHHQHDLATILHTTRELLFSPSDIDQPTFFVRSLDVIDELGEHALECLNETEGFVYDTRLSQPHAMPLRMRGRDIHSGFWNAVADRLGKGSIAVRRVEIIYCKDRLKELMRNIIKYEDVEYWVKYYPKTPGKPGVRPAINMMSFDYVHFFIGAYFVSLPPPDQHRQMLWLRGEPFASFLKAYFELLYERAIFLNPSGPDDWQEVRRVAENIGISGEEWEQLLEEVTTGQEPKDPPRI